MKIEDRKERKIKKRKRGRDGKTVGGIECRGEEEREGGKEE